MAGTVIYPNGPGGPDSQMIGQTKQPWYVTHPWLAIGLGGVVAIVLFAVVARAKNSTSGASAAGSSANANNTGPTTDANGNPVEYVATSDLFYNYTNTTGSYNTTDSNNVTNTTNNNPPPPPPPPVGFPPPPKPKPKPPGDGGEHKSGDWSCTYTVQGGDTLSRIAAARHTTWPQIYSHNKSRIDLIAAAMDSIIPGGPWNNIRPGEVLTVPCN